MKSIFLAIASTLLVSSAFASDITAQSIIGKYRIDAKALGKSATFRLIVLNDKEFEIQRLFADHDGKLCNGNFTVHHEHRHWPLKDATYFDGKGSCPDDRSKVADLRINFKEQSLKDIKHGATIAVTSSMAAGFTLNAHIQEER